MWARRRNKKYVKKVNKYVDDIDQLVDRDVATFFFIGYSNEFPEKGERKKDFYCGQLWICLKCELMEMLRFLSVFFICIHNFYGLFFCSALIN